MQKSLFFLCEMTDADIQWLIYSGQRLQLHEAEVLVEQGVHADALYILLTGMLSVWLDGPSGKREVTRLTSGEVIGEISFIDSRLPSATVVAVVPSLLLAVPKDLLTKKIAADEGFGLRFYKAMAYFLSDRLRTTMSRIDSFAGTVTTSGIPDEPPPDIIARLPLAQHRLARMIKQLQAIR